MAMIRASATTGPAAEANVKSVHIVLLDAASVLDEVSGGLADANRPAPTDIFVSAGQPFHFAGEPGRLIAHPDAHHDFKETILYLRVQRDSVLWWSEKEFHIDNDIRLADDHAHPALLAAEREPPAANPPKSPFSASISSRAIKDSSGKVLFWEARSTAPAADAHGHQYKISFTIEGQTIDPDMFCGGG